MINLSAIQQSVAVELEDLNANIRRVLTSDSQLLQSVIDHYLKVKGKQIRPILVILSAKVLGTVHSKVIDGAAAIELLHNASLVHDDVIDESRRRRGNPTINSVWHNHVAVLVGDYFVAKSLELAIRTDDMRVLETMSRLGSELSRGEIDQIDNARNNRISIQSYFDIISYKTASLFRSCVEVGGYCVDAKGESFTRLCKFAELLGLCFQIRDDIFDYFSDDNIGKPYGNDLRENKITLPLIYALDSCQSPEAENVRTLLNSKDPLSSDEINRIIEFAKENGGIDYAYSEMHRLRNEALELIAPIPDSESLEAFRTIFDYIIKRRY